jgi:hypothetical protein
MQLSRVRRNFLLDETYNSFLFEKLCGDDNEDNHLGVIKWSPNYTKIMMFPTKYIYEVPGSILTEFQCEC